MVMATVALIVAAGRGVRLGQGVAKQYRKLDGRTVLYHAAAAFAGHPAVDHVVVVIGAGDRDLYDDAVDGLALLEPVVGGANRRASVLAGLESLAAIAPDRVLIHDGARPFPSPEVIDAVLEALDRTPGAIAAVAVADSLKRGAGGRITGAVDRDGLWRAQTPQGFRFADILAAHRAAADSVAAQGAADNRAADWDLTDDAAVAEQAGLAVSLVEGAEDNFKITTAADLARARRLAEGRLGIVRVGTGFDVHRFGPARPLMLCGVAVDHDQGLIGHSDADVGLHALTDAILGALAAGDIGEHFPASDPAWRDAASDRFVAHAGELVARAGGMVAAVDLTVIAEAPKIAPHRVAMRMRIAEILAIPVERVSVKATSTERLGFTGRGEGIAAQAVVTLRLPA